MDKNSTTDIWYLTDIIWYLLCSEQPSVCFMNIMKLNHIFEVNQKRSVFADLLGVLIILANTVCRWTVRSMEAVMDWMMEGQMNKHIDKERDRQIRRKIDR